MIIFITTHRINLFLRKKVTKQRDFIMGIFSRINHINNHLRLTSSLNYFFLKRMETFETLGIQFCNNCPNI